jgi:alpha-L-fucosidase
MFDSQYTDYKCTNTSAGRDLLRELIDAFRAEGLRIGIYYSLIDWHHPDFTVDILHPRRKDENAEAKTKVAI